jgi:hypothetical protein
MHMSNGFSDDSKGLLQGRAHAASYSRELWECRCNHRYHSSSITSYLLLYHTSTTSHQYTVCSSDDGISDPVLT